MKPPAWWSPPWAAGTDLDPDTGWSGPIGAEPVGVAWPGPAERTGIHEETIIAPLEAQFDQVRSRDRVRDLAEVFTHQREVDAILDTVADAFSALDVKFLEPTCGSGNFLTEVLRRKLRLVAKADCVSQEQYEHRMLRAVASIYGVDISPENIAEGRARMAHVLLEHYLDDANTIEPTPGFLNAAVHILASNTVLGDTLNAAHTIELCDWLPRSGGCFQRVWSFPLVPPAERDLFWTERVQDQDPVHYSKLAPAPRIARPSCRKATR